MKSIDAKLKASPRQARSVITESFHGRPSSARRSYLKFLSASIEFLSSNYGDRWGVTLFDNGIRLNAGWTEVLVLEQDCVKVLVNRDVVPSGTKIFFHGFETATGCGLTRVPLSELPYTLPHLSEAHHSAISIVAKRKTTKYIREAHSVGVTRFLSEFFGQPVPDPTYYLPEPAGRDYLVLWKYSEALDVNGRIMTRAVGTHAGGLNRTDRMFVIATSKDRLYILGAIEVEHSGKSWSSGTSLFGAFQILPLRTLTWKLRFNSSNASQLSKESTLAWQVRSRRSLTPGSALLLEELLEKGKSHQRERFAATEGKLKEFTLSKRERDPRVRASALAERGTACEMCGFDFAATYGEFATNCVEVHHLRLLAKVEDEEVTTYMKDVRVVCPNCHRALHRFRKPEDWVGFRKSCDLE